MQSYILLCALVVVYLLIHLQVVVSTPSVCE